LRSSPVKAFIETGTFRGETSFLVAVQTDLPIYTCDLNPEYHCFAKDVLTGFDDRVTMVLDDSPSFLRSLLVEHTIANPFFHLDAHWYKDIPLREELRTILLSGLEDFVIMIDDFKVPTDSGFGFDRYGEISMQWSYIADIVEAFSELAVFFPAFPSSIETGARRGIILIVSGLFIEALRKLCAPALLYEEDTRTTRRDSVGH
jgi:hypothetical protein